MKGSQAPRIEVIPKGDEHPRWSEVCQFVVALGLVLDPWQLRVLWASLLRRGSIWAAFSVGVCAPRQNGKNAILEARELIGPCILDEKLVIHSAHRADTSMEGFRRLDDLLDANEWLSKDVKHIRRQNGHETITFRNGNRIRFRTRGGQRGGGRGFSGSPVMFDEAMFLSDESMGAIHPVMSAQPDPQAWYMGSAVDQMTMDEGIVFTRLREEAQSEDSDRIAYFEWSLDLATPDDVEDEVAEDLASWAVTNPALGIRITPEYLRAEQRALDLRTFAVERLGVGDWPKTNGAHTVFDLDLWHRLVDPASSASAIALSFDVRPDRSRGVICAAGRRADGDLHVEVIDQRGGVGWIVPRLVELEQRHMPLGIVCDGVGPASSLIPELLQANVGVTVLETPQMAEACGMMFDAVSEERLRHLGQPELLHAIKGAVQRPLGDRWAWSRRNSTSDISPLVGVTAGVWKVVTEEQQAPMFAFG